MPAFQWGATIGFGPFVNIGVRVKSAVVVEKIAFEMLHNDPECHGNAGYSQAWGCKKCGQPLPNGKGDTVSGFRGHVVDSEYIKGLSASATKLIELDALVPASQIDPRYYQQSYDVTPEVESAKSYMLLVRLLERSGRVAIGKAILGGKEQIVTLRPRDGILALEIMFWPDDLTRGGRDEAAREITQDIVVTDQELAIGDQLAALMSKDFDPTAYRNEYGERLKDYLATVEDGTAAPVLPAPAAGPAASTDLLAALQASINAANRAAPKPAAEGVA